MLCEDCGKNQATVHFTKIINGKVIELHLCESCAAKHKEFEINPSFSFHKFLTGLLDNMQEGQVPISFEQEIKCDSCGMTYDRFKQIGKFGCSNCYESFRKKLTLLFRQIHGHDTHVGKVPKRAGGKLSVRREIERLKSELDAKVQAEEFEQAAVIRDKIKELQNKINE